MAVVELLHEDRFIISILGSNLLDGAWWGFCPIETYNEIGGKYFSSRRTDVCSFHTLKQDTGVLISVDPNYGFDILSKVDGFELDKTDVEGAIALNMAGVLALRLFLEKNDSYQGFIGVNEISDSINVTISQKLYPSFKVSHTTVMDEFSKMCKIEYLNENNQWVKYSNDTTEEEFVRCFTMSPTRNCMVLPIRYSRG